MFSGLRAFHFQQAEIFTNLVNFSHYLCGDKGLFDILNMEPIIQFSGADIINGETTVIYGLNLSVSKGDFVYIVGKVGTGKTSIIRTMIAEHPLEKGEGKVCGYDLKAIKDRDIPFLRRKLGVVFQDFQLLMDRSVHDNLLFVLEATGWKGEAEKESRIGEVLSAVGMERKAHKMPYQLSGGEQQRIAIARAILNRPEAILADEPTGNLDAETADGIMNLLCKLNRENGTAVVMVTHNLQLCEKYPGRVLVCKNESCEEMDREPQTENEDSEKAEQAENKPIEEENAADELPTGAEDEK